MSNKKANNKTTSNKKLFVVFSAIAIMVAIPLALHSTYQQKNTQSGNTESVLAAQTQSNDLGRVTANIGINMQSLSSTVQTASTKRTYIVGATSEKGNFCWNKSFSYKINGLKFSSGSRESVFDTNLCMMNSFTGIESSANCNTFTMITPTGYKNVGIAYKRIDRGLQNFSYEQVASKKLCDYNYIVLFAIEKN